MDHRQADGTLVVYVLLGALALAFVIFMVAEQVAISRNKKRGDR